MASDTLIGNQRVRPTPDFLAVDSLAGALAVCVEGLPAGMVSAVVGIDVVELMDEKGQSVVESPAPGRKAG